MRFVSGMTLIEVMIASAALVTGIFSVFGAMGASAQVRNRAKLQGIAVECIQAQVERLQAMGYNSVCSAVPKDSGMGFDVPGVPTPTGRSQAGSIVREADSTTSRLHLRFTVDWTDASGPSSVVIHYHHVNRGG
jgi:Tfp pilus assembly protein PilV